MNLTVERKDVKRQIQRKVWLLIRVSGHFMCSEERRERVTGLVKWWSVYLRLETTWKIRLGFVRTQRETGDEKLRI
jgi:hypothetical protein